MYKVAHGSQISSAKQKKEEEEVEDMGTCAPALLMGARRPGAVGSVLKLNPTLIHCSAFTWSPKLEKPLTFMDKEKTFQKKTRHEDPPQVFRIIKVIRVSCVTSVERTEMDECIFFI